MRRPSSPRPSDTGSPTTARVFSAFARAGAFFLVALLVAFALMSFRLPRADDVELVVGNLDRHHEQEPVAIADAEDVEAHLVHRPVGLPLCQRVVQRRLGLLEADLV